MNRALATYVMELVLRNLVFWGRMGSSLRQWEDHLWQQAFQFNQEGFTLQLPGVGILKSLCFEADNGNRCPGPGVGSQSSKAAPKVQDKGNSYW